MKLLSTAVLLSAPLILHAQSARTDSLLLADDLNQVVVTGTRTPKTLLNTPVLTRVISHAEIEKADATTLQDILQLSIPGVEFSYSMNQQRHMNFSGFGGQSMLILVNGERLAGENMDDVDFDRLTLSNVDHIEIVKGPVSALYGSNASGGVINIITKQNTKPFALNVNARLGKHNNQRYGLDWQQGGKKWSSIFDFSRTNVDNYNVESAENPIASVISTVYGGETYNFKEQLTYVPFKNLHLSGNAGYFFRQLKRSEDTPERYRDYNAGLKASWKINENDDLYGSYSFDQYDKSNFQSISKLDIRYYSNVQNAFRLLYNHSFNKGHILTLGADYLHDYLQSNRLNGTYTQQSADAFVQYDGQLSPIWELVAALRYDYFHDDTSLSRLTPKISIRHTPLRGLNVRFGYAMGFRAPSLKEKYYEYDAAGIWTIIGNPDLKPEFSNNYNISVEYHWRNYELLLNICYLVLNGLLQTTEDGTYKLLAFSDEHMERLFEKFVLEYYKQHHPELNPDNPQIEWNHTKKPDDNMIQFLPKMQSDIVLTKGEKKLIIDAKYYSKAMSQHYDKETFRSAHLYQIYAYVKNMDKQNTGNVSGLLLYAKTEDEVFPDGEPFEIGGNSIGAKTLDLNNSFSEIKYQLDIIGRGVF